MDAFARSPIDLRGLNEPFAGENGFIEVRGDAFVQAGSGRPVRFWAVNAEAGIAPMDNTSVDHLARFLAKYGVNLVRYHRTMPLLCAAYGALQGSDGFHFFSLSGPWWPTTMTSKWTIQTPVTMGQFPAMALIFRKGLVHPAPPVVEVE